MKKFIFYSIFGLFFISANLFAMEEIKRKAPEKEEETTQTCPEIPQPLFKRRKIIAKPPQLKSLQQISLQKFIEVAPEVDNLPEILASIPDEEIKNQIKAEFQKRLPFEETRLHNAATEQEVENFLTLGVNPNLKDRNGKTALNALIDKGHLNAAFHLVAIALAAIPYENIPLEELEKNETIDPLIKAFLIATQGQGLDVSSYDKYWVTPLQRAIEHQDADLVDSIIEILQGREKIPFIVLGKAKYINLPNTLNNNNQSQWSAFTLAIRYTPELVEKFINLGALVNTKNEFGETPLMFAINFNQSLIPILIKAGANINAKDKKGKMVLMYAAQNKNLDALKMLLEARPLLNKQNNEGITPLMYAAKYNTEAVQLLINAKADINVEDSDGQTALYYAAQFNPSAIEPLIDAGADPNKQDSKGSFPLLAAVEHGELEGITELLGFGADPNNKNNDDFDALTIAIDNDQLEIVKILLGRGAQVTKNNLENVHSKPEIKVLLMQDALISAIRRSDENWVKEIVNVGTNLNFRDNDDQTPLEIAIEYREPEIVKILLEGGAQVTDQALEKAQGKAEIYNLIAQNYASMID